MNQVQTSHALSQSSSASVIQLDDDYQPTCSNNSVPINPGLQTGSSPSDNMSHLRSIYHSTVDAAAFCSSASTHIVSVPVSSVVGSVEPPVLRGGDGGGSSSSGSSTTSASVAFHIKRESDTPGSPPGRSLSVHSLPSNCSAPSYFVDISTAVRSHATDSFCVRKHEFTEETRARSSDPSQAPLPTQQRSVEHVPCNNCEPMTNPFSDLHEPSDGAGVSGYISSCSSVSGSRTILSQSPFHLDTSQAAMLFGNQRYPLSNALSILPLPSQISGAVTLNSNDRCTSTIAPLEINSGTITTAVGQPMDSSPAFYSNETISSLSNFAILPVSSRDSTVVATVAPLSLLGATRNSSTNGNGHFNTGFRPCDLSASNLIQFEQNPRVKSRRYSYPQEPVELCRQQYAKEIHMSAILDNNNGRPSHHSTPSPHMFKTVPSISPCVVTHLDPTVPIGGARLNGCHTLSTPMSSCGGEDVPGGASSAGGDSQQDQKLIFAPDGADIALPGFDSPEAAFYQYQHRMEGQRCQVCGELAAGFHHGAYVCEACKKFFMRHSLTDTKPTNVCPTGGNCVVAKGSRGKCQICRYRKCLLVGMKMKDPELQPEVDISNIPCRVCGGRSSGFHFGALTCEGCKGFFRRTEGSAGSLVCVGGQNTCTITPRSRNACKSCRFRRCLVAGMSKKGSRIGRQPNAVKFHCAIEIKQLQGSRSVIYPGGSNDPSGSGSSSHYGPFSVDVGGQVIDVTGPASLQNLSDVDSPNKCSPPDGFTPTFRSRQNSTPWTATGAGSSGNVSIGSGCAEQKPPLSLLLFLPPGSDPIDSNAPCGSFSDSGAGGNNLSRRIHCSSGLPQSQHILRPTAVSMNSDDHVISNHRLRLPSADHMPSNHQLRLPSPVRSSHPLDMETHSASEDDDDVHSPTQHPRYRSVMDRTNTPASHGGASFDCGLPSVITATTTCATLTTTTTTNRTAGRSGLNTLPSLLHPFGFSTVDPAVNYSGVHKQPITTTTTNTTANSPQAMTALLITNLAKRLAEEDQLAVGAADEMEDVMTSYPPSPEAIHHFTDGMRTATEFLRLPNTYFKSRFRMTSIPLDHQDNTVHVWSHMMNHFHMHAQQIVQFAKLVPGFNQLGITARSNLVRGAMYPVVLLLLSRDYRPETDEFNYFDFTLEERDIIMHHFPSFLRITEHLRIAGCLLHGLGLTLTELSLSSAVEILRNYQLLEEPTKSNTKELFVLAHHSLRSYMIGSTETAGSVEYGNQHRWTQLMVLSKMIHAMNREHHQILSNLKDVRSDLHFPELYIEMFQLADSASALFSASAKAVTLACSSAFQSLAPLKLSSSQPTVGTNVAQASSSSYGISDEMTMVSCGEHQQQLPPEQQQQQQPNSAGTSGFLPVVDRWDAGRFALAVPAAMAAVAAAAAEASSSSLGQSTVPPLRHHTQSSVIMNQVELQKQPEQRSNSSGHIQPPFFPAPPSIFFPPQTHPSP